MARRDEKRRKETKETKEIKPSKDIKEDIKEKVTEFLELPKEIIMNVPKIIFIGNQNLSIENYKGIIEYTENTIRINTNEHMLKIIGRDLEIKNIAAEEMLITGNIMSLEFIV